MVVAGEVEVEVLHGQYLAVATTRGTTFDTKSRTHRRLPDCGDSLQSKLAEALDEPHNGRRLSLSERSGGDRGYVDVLASGTIRNVLEDIEVYLGLVVTKRNQVTLVDAELGSNLDDRLDICGLGDIKIGWNRR